jgi:hypothetical protein
MKINSFRGDLTAIPARKESMAQVCVSTGGSGLASIYSGDKGSQLDMLLASVSSKLDTSNFWIGGAYFGQAGSDKVTAPSNWFWFPSWNTSFTSLATFSDARATTSNPWLWKNSFPSIKAEYYTSEKATDKPNSCMIVRHDASESSTWWEQRACGGSSVSGVSAFVRTHTPPHPSSVSFFKINLFIFWVL